MKTPDRNIAGALWCSWLSGLLICLSGCHGAWIASNASGVAHRLAASRPQHDLVSELETTSRLRSQLELLPDLLEFARKRGLKVGNAYQRIDVLAGPVSWIVVAADPKLMELHQWSFPLVGKVPYKGYRFRDHAQQEADQLVSIGLESEVMPIDAWSSLGWFPDPVPRALLDLPEYRWVTTLLHELVHRTLHIPNDAQLNESLATFLGNRLAQQWLVSRYGADGEQAIRHRHRYQDELRLNRLVRQYREDLLTRPRELAHEQFLAALSSEPWEAFSGVQLAAERWSLVRVLMAEIYDPEAISWDQIWAQTGQDLSNLAIWLRREKVGTSAAKPSSGP